jgi:predicted kinase
MLCKSVNPSERPTANGQRPTLIVFVGLPASGKTTYYRSHFADTHVHVSRDLMPNARRRDDRQERAITDALESGRSVVVDNTNPSPVVRAPLIALGRQHGARIIAYYFETAVKDCLVRNRQREGKARVPDVAIFVTSKKLVPPAVSEGFDEVHVVSSP